MVHAVCALLLSPIDPSTHRPIGIFSGACAIKNRRAAYASCDAGLEDINVPRSDLPPEPPSSEITPEPQYNSRREFIKNAGLFALTAGSVGAGLTLLTGRARPKQVATQPITRNPLHLRPRLQMSRAPIGDDKVLAIPEANPWAESSSARNWPGGEARETKFESASTYNNYYEFGTDKSDPAANAHTLKPRPWTVSIEGECAKPQTVDIDTLIKWAPLEERVYRMRCVEAWSMVIPWVGFSLSVILNRVEPNSKAKYVAFRTLMDTEQMPGEKRRILQWPYSEGLRMDEAMHPLTMLAVGIYGRVLPNQNGAPLRLVVPWKYGFKGIKAIVKIKLMENQPLASWNQNAPDEYGFYANVNPAVDHPRWSQATERRIWRVDAPRHAPV